MTGKLVRDTSTAESRTWWDGVLNAANRVRDEESVAAESDRGGSKVTQDAESDDTQQRKNLCR